MKLKLNFADILKNDSSHEKMMRDKISKTFTDVANI